MPQIRGHGREGSEFSFFFILDVGVRLTPMSKKILDLPPSVPRHRICGDRKGNNSNPSIRHPSIRGSFMDDDGHWRSGFTRPGSDHTSVSRTGVFSIFLKKSFLTKTSMAMPRSHGPGFFPPFLTWDVSDYTTDPVCETGI